MLAQTGIQEFSNRIQTWYSWLSDGLILGHLVLPIDHKFILIIKQYAIYTPTNKPFIRLRIPIQTSENSCVVCKKRKPTSV